MKSKPYIMGNCTSELSIITDTEQRFGVKSKAHVLITNTSNKLSPKLKLVIKGDGILFTVFDEGTISDKINGLKNIALHDKTIVTRSIIADHIQTTEVPPLLPEESILFDIGFTVYSDKPVNFLKVEFPGTISTQKYLHMS